MNINTANSGKSPLWWVGYVPAWLFLLFVGWLLISFGASVLIPLLLSFALAFIIEPVVDWFEKRGNSRTVAVLLALAVAALVILLIGVVLLPGVYSQLRESIEKLPLALGALNAELKKLLAFAHDSLSATVYTQIQNWIDGFENDPSALTSRVGGYLSEGLFGLVSLGSTAVGLVVVPFFVYYLLVNMRVVRAFLEKRLPERFCADGNRLLDEIGVVMRVYVRGRFLIALIQSAVYALGLFLLGIPLWAAIAVIAGVANFIPYFGVIVGGVLAFGFALLAGASALKLLAVVAVLTAAQMFEDYFLTPKIVDEKLDLHPMFVFIALIIGGSLFGLLGIVMAIPVLGVIRVFLKFFDELYLRSDFYLQPISTVDAVPAAAVLTAVAAPVSGEQVENVAATPPVIRGRITAERK